MMQFALNTHGSSMRNDNMLHDGKPQTGSTGLSRTCLVHALEALEEPRQMFRRDAGAGVANKELDIAIALVSSDYDGRSGWAILHRI